ncbi:C-terminal binding protein [Halalkalicoccus jeotgali]|uniref:D-isomer specific 2-hydroxyacid dehydrogenase protein n=1 Tax=Halalkalicoccus jeotgali (strain DSM 18796 / CECT 7217 / JCM 14584 / KCTC 4019 / B3) TaxID=795797 RepID=D8J8B3_HALJB|nr:C-terminal binding protein [Halalkalicoccus jeotgali]ADJ16159.1 D-isomer specific 2-hydroxyacid dehydrogenase, NAD-binding protein [Halalkalicoccus jeotgali B3]ELY37588.1 D-isomer specific 2-hydroxyacid dehydrogenase protein [Halalkalicoccus jeotgali B3]
MNSTVLVTDFDFPDLDVERELAAEAGVEIESAAAADPEAVIEAAREVGADALLVQFAPITRTVFEELDLDVVGRYGIGVDTVDCEAAADHGVPVVNVPDYCQDEVAEHALALTLSCVRETARFDARITDGEWDWTVGRPINRLQGATVGFVGFGSIPERLAAKASGFDFEYLAYDPYRSAEDLAEAGVEKVGFGELLERSRVVSVHAPLTDETHGLLDDEAFATMRDDAVLVNTARGAVVDTTALAAAIEDGGIAGAGLDVMPEEPPEESALFGLEDVVLTPHVAWYSEESIAELRETVVRDVLSVLSGEEPTNPV